jgi:hypothetical protein
MSATVAAAIADPNLKKLTLDFAAKQVLPMLQRVVGKVKDDRKLAELADRYACHLTERVALCKTFLHHEKPRHIRRVYQPVALRGINAPDGGESAKRLFGLGRCVAIIGHAGAGKTMLLKRLCFDALESHSCIPVFLEFRRFTKITKTGETKPTIGIREAICRAVFGTDLNDIGERLTEAFLSSSSTAVFLDGFDEIPSAYRASYANELLFLNERFDKAKWVVTSRPDEMISRMDHIYVTQPMPLTLDLALRHIERFDVDAHIQEEFSSLLKAKLYKNHRTFASNPLLLAVLFLTFRTYKRIDEREHVFFEEVFDALCSRHDQRKGGFERELRSGLTKDDLVRTVQLFCFITALREIYEFSRAELRAQGREVVTNSGLACETDKLLEDLVQSISLLTEDGSHFTFLHKSLQEFLAAKYVTTMPSELQVDALARISPEPLQSMSLLLMLGLNRDLVEGSFAVPLLAAMVAMIERWDLATPGGMCGAVAIALSRRQEFRIALPTPWVGSMDFRSALGMIERLYPAKSLVGPSGRGSWWIDKATGSVYETDEEILKAGLDYYKANGHLGGADGLIGINLGEASAIPVLYRELKNELEARQAGKQHLDAFVSKMLRRTRS